VIRLNKDGSIPSDNPFYNTPDAKKEIWSYGHRNPQGIFFDKATNRLYEQEHGPKGGDEINLIVKGKNYGWPVITFGREYSGGPVGNGETHREGMEQAIKYFVPSIAPSSLMIYQGETLKIFKDKFVSGSLALQHLNLVSTKDSLKACEDRLLLKLEERIRDVKQGPDGLIYVSSDNGRIYVIKPGVK
jgi:glucose/arabinose dehydrogenase